ncbi:hypothetical protein AOZ06_31910 [Kibdelosporangium phytohabitans]|uniref:Uncharacterized protein n=1 Tax=Kibdelosporangium phytohabitans TaxID=860235 RepID=A0A0N7F4A4_9PSEU|nr:hypothetical protein AOZ06_31910 [Kibdelosporangium phytohabitans]
MVGAWLLLAGFSSLWLGVAWDGQWHVDVGPDTFFTAPHLMFYFGTSLIGLTSLAVVLKSQRDMGPALRVFGLRTPLPFLVGGLGAAGHLLYGATDLWWHTVYGFDILEDTPSHLSLSIAMQVQAIAVIMAFAALRTTTSGRWGLAAAGALNVAAASILLDGTLLGIDLTVLAGGAIAAWTLSAIAGTTRTARWVLAVGLVFIAVQAATYFFPLLATELYADGIGQPIRDYALGLPVVALAMPAVFPIVAAIVAAAIELLRRRDLAPITAMTVVGAGVGLMAALYMSFLEPDAGPLLNIPAITAMGALGGRFGWQCAALMRRLGSREAVVV